MILTGVYFSIDNEKSTPEMIACKHPITLIIHAYRIIKKESTHVKNPLPSVQPPTYYTQAGTSNSTLPKYNYQPSQIPNHCKESGFIIDTRCIKHPTLHNISAQYIHHSLQEKHRRTSNGSTGSYSADSKRVCLIIT